jgi:hypothetical protein
MKLLSRQVFLSVTYGVILLQGTCQRFCPPPPRPAERLWIGHIRNTREMLAECGCGLQFPSDSRFYNGASIFVSDWAGNALMNINGVDIRMYGGAFLGPGERLRPGQRFSAGYSAGDTRVRVNYVVTDTCDETVRRCKMSYVRATLTVGRITETNLTMARRYSAVGACGCP